MFEKLMTGILNSFVSLDNLFYCDNLMNLLTLCFLAKPSNGQSVVQNEDEEVTMALVTLITGFNKKSVITKRTYFQNMLYFSSVSLRGGETVLAMNQNMQWFLDI